MNRLLSILSTIANSPQAAAAFKVLGDVSPQASFAILAIGILLHGSAAVFRSVTMRRYTVQTLLLTAEQAEQLRVQLRPAPAPSATPSDEDR